MKRITILRILYILLLLIVGGLFAVEYGVCTPKDYIMPIIIIACSFGIGYANRMIDEEEGNI